MLRISTSGLAAQHRSRHWHEAIAQAYFPLDLEFRRPESFGGELEEWALGDVSLSRLRSEPLRYRRLSHHLRGEREECFLVTVPVKAEVFFTQAGKEVHCPPGGLLIERSHEPYVFSHDDAADLWVLKISHQALSGRVGRPDRFCSMRFDATAGSGSLLRDMLDLLPRRLETMSPELCATVGRQLVDLVALSLKEDERTLTAAGSSVRAAHVLRIEAFVRDRLGDPDLDPERIAAACQISTRYLHELFRHTGRTIAGWIRDLRLDRCRAELGDPLRRRTIAEIAYRAGFSDQAQFSRLFRARFGASPRDYREQALRAERTPHPTS